VKGNSEGKRQLGRYRPILDDNIKIGLKEMSYYGGNWIHLTEKRYYWRALVNTIVNTGGSHTGSYEEVCHMGYNAV
jgi:hypothetical protein